MKLLIEHKVSGHFIQEMQQLREWSRKEIQQYQV